MNKRGFAGTTVGLGTAALLGVGGAGCPTPPTTGQPESADAAVAQDAATAEPTPPPVEPMAADAAAPTEPTEPTPAADAATEPQLPPGSGPAVEDDCAGPAQFTERCGYPSPARYAVLHPGRIRNG